MEFTTNRSQNRTLHVEQRLQALILAEEGIAIKIVQAITKMSVRTINDLKKKARQRDYDFKVSRVLKIEYVKNAPRFDKFSKITSAVSSIIILRVLKRNDFRSCKSTMKLDLNEVMMKARLQFCLRYKN